MKPKLTLVAALVLMASQPSAAHRLDEYLQASRLSVAREGIVVELDLTPGVSVAARVAASVDSDRDGQLSPTEVEAYGRLVLSDVSLAVNNAPVPLMLTRAEAPTLAEMTDGMGTIRLTAVGELGDGGGHRLLVKYRNDHQADSGVFLVNAMVPRVKGLALSSQKRDAQQREIRLEYDVSSTGRTQLDWLVVAVMGVGGLVAFRSRQRSVDQPVFAK